MRIKLICVGTKMPSWVESGFNEYAKRMPGEMALQLRELAVGHRGKGADIKRAIASEGDAMLAAIPKGDRIIALDVLGKAMSTEQMAEQLSALRMEGQHLSLLVGGPDGLDPRCLALADRKWSLSKLTLPHPLVRVLLAEQLYRSWTIIQGHPYHK